VLQVPGRFSTIQGAIDMAADGDTVLVAPGEYVISKAIEFNRLHDPADAKSPPVRNIILRSERGAAETTIRLQEPGPEVPRSSVMIFKKGEDRSSILEGFTLTGGTGSPPLSDGGGIYIQGSSATIRGCSITRNAIFGKGGGIYCEDGSPLIHECTIADNSAGSYGGAMFCTGDSSVDISLCSIVRNEADWTGGLLFEMARSSARIMDCDLSENVGRNAFAAALEAEHASVSLTNCKVSRNIGIYRSVRMGINSRVTAAPSKGTNGVPYSAGRRPLKTACLPVTAQPPVAAANLSWCAAHFVKTKSSASRCPIERRRGNA